MQPKKISPVTQQALDHYAAQVHELNNGSDNPQLHQARNNALEILRQQAFPTQRDEDWQYTRLTGFLQSHFAAKPAGHVTAEQINAFLPDFPVTKVVFVDGWFNESLSDDLSGLPDHVIFETFSDVSDSSGNINKLFASENEVCKEPFGVLNSCLAADGFYMQLAANKHLDMPLYVLYVQTNDEQLSSVRNRIEVGENAEFTLVERYVSLQSDESESFTNVVTQIDVAKHARVRQIIMQELGDNDFYFNNQYIFQQENSSFDTFFGSVSCQVARHQNHLWMDGEHIENNQNSACLAKQKQTVDSRSHTLHNDVWGVSQQLHKFVLTDNAIGVFNGMIRVDQKAQKTDGQMDNKNLLLSNQAKMDTKPQLEIYADDVKCSHGSATGQIDENQIFYLQARGIKRADAIKMITHAFLLEPAELIGNNAIRNWVLNRLSIGLEKIHQ